MSLVTIIAKGSSIINWESLHTNIEAANLTELEIFPIPFELGFEVSAIGIAVPSNYKSKEAVLEELKRVTNLLGSMNFKLTELYNGEVVTYSNVSGLLNTLLGG